MFLRILKKDLKRKKTMNIILLLFIILASTFISSSVNNLVTITSALDNYFEKAKLGDYLIIYREGEENNRKIQDFLKSRDYLESYTCDEARGFSKENIVLESGEKVEIKATGALSSYNIKQQKFFDSKNNKIDNMKEGEIYTSLSFLENNNLESGDVFYLQDGNYKKKFTIVGNTKDAFLGSSMMGMERMIVSEADFKEIRENTHLQKQYFNSVKTDDVERLDKEFADQGYMIIFSGGIAVISMAYIMDMVIAGVLLIVSICLILISLLILRFTIIFTLNEEFREIGIMKAIGIRQQKIRSIYIVKYLAASITGAVIGFIAGIPFGNLFTQQAARNILMDARPELYFLNVLCCIFIVGIVMLFCYQCTGKINHASAIEAIRNGADGERFSRKGVLHLGKSRMPVPLFMACNDIMSGLKRFIILIVTFTLGIILVIVPITTINTLNSDGLVKWFGMAESDVFMSASDREENYAKRGDKDYILKELNKVETKLAEEGIPVEAHIELIFRLKVAHGENSINTLCLQGLRIKANEYSYDEGEAPRLKNEVAVTKTIAEKLDAKIGDTICLDIGEGEKDYLITGIYQSMNNMGESVRFSEKESLKYENLFSCFAIQMNFKDEVTAEERAERIAKIARLYSEENITDGKTYVGQLMGGVTGQMDGIKYVIILVVSLINVLVAILMVKTFISKEKGEIAMLKSIGFSNASLVIWQVLRIGIVLVVSAVLGALLSTPITRISAGQIFKIMGAGNIEFVIKPLEVFVLMPGMILILTLIASFLTALHLRKISSNETNNME